MPYKAGKLYCSMAKQNGTIIEKTDKLITIKYEDNTTETITLGTLYGKMEGSVFPHVVISDRTLNQKLKQGDYISYNTGFFEKDWLDPTRLIMKFGKLATIALTMTNEVFEDSSAISSKFSKEMSTTIVKEKSFVIEFTKNIINLIPEQTSISPNDILFTLTDENLDYNNLSDSTIEMLQGLANTSPKAKVNGVLDKYEVIYNGDVSDMSPSLKKLVNRLDKNVYDSTKGTQYELSNNKVNSEYRVEGKNLSIDTLELKVYIKVELTQAIGDKGVVASQMKSVVSDVFTSDVHTESGRPIDMQFSFKGILGRVVNSPILAGTTNSLLKHISKQVVEVYFNK